MIMEETSERRGSVTSLLRAGVEQYLVPTTSPADSTVTAPEPDCWDEFNSADQKDDKTQKGAKKEDKKGAQMTGTAKDGKRSKTEASSKGKGAKPDENVQKPGFGSSMASPALGLMKFMTPEKSAPKAPTAKSVKDKTGEKNDEEEEEEEVKVVLMGCSKAYEAAINEIRGTGTSLETLVLLGLPSDEEEEFEGDDTIGEPANHPPLRKSTFTVAMAASKIRILGGLSRGAGSTTGSESQFSIMNEIKKQDKSVALHNQRIRPGKKMFEDAYITTWSQSVLDPDDKEFCITFDKPKKVRVIRVRKVSRRKSSDVTSELVAQQVQDEETGRATDWLRWRMNHDRVNDWLRNNSLVEPDESHVIAMLVDPDPKKGALYRT